MFGDLQLEHSQCLDEHQTLQIEGHHDGLRVRALTMNHSIPSSHPAGSVSCMSFPISLFPHFLFPLLVGIINAKDEQLRQTISGSLIKYQRHKLACIYRNIRREVERRFPVSIHRVESNNHTLWKPFKTFISLNQIGFWVIFGLIQQLL